MTMPGGLGDGARVLVVYVVQGWGIPALASIRLVRARGRPTTLV
jgi:hypothetical protein